MTLPQIPPPQLSLKWIAEYHGPNPFAGTSLVVAELRGDLPADIAQVRTALTDLWARSRMDRGVDDIPDPVAQDVMLALGQGAASWTRAVLNEVRGFVRHAGAERTGDAVRLWVGFHHVGISRSVLQLALSSLMQSMSGQVDLPALDADLHRLWLSCRKHHPDYQARILMVGAQDMGVPHLQFLPGSRYWQFGWGTKARVFMESSSNADGLLGSQWQQSKTVGKALMASLGLPTPAHVLLQREEDLPAGVEHVGLPCVVKPLDAGGGRGVTANIRTIAEARAAFAGAFRQRRGAVMIEAHVPGDDHRLMVIDGRVVAVIRRQPSAVVGDGHKTVAELMDELNAPRSSNMVRSRYLRPIAADPVLDQHLATQSLRLNDVPAAGRRVTLRSNANLSTGGQCTDVTAVCHPQVRAMAVLLARASGLATVGIDYLTTDISRSPAETGGVFIEMNTTPGLDACVAAGWSESSIACKVLGDRVGRIPIDLTVLSSAGLQALRVGIGAPRLADDEALVIGNDLYFDETCLHVEAAEPWAAVKASLRNVDLEKLRVICSADDFVRLGCPVDCCRQVTVAVREDDEVLSDAWIEVLARHSEWDVLYDREQDIIQRLIEKEIVRSSEVTK